MKYQQVTVDVWKMTVTAVSYLALAFAAWVLLRLVSACITLPSYLRKQQAEEEAEERRLLLEMQEGGEDDDEDDDEEEDDDEHEAPGDEAAAGDDQGVTEEAAMASAGDAVAVPSTPRATGRGRRRVRKGAEAPGGELGGAPAAAQTTPDREDAPVADQAPADGDAEKDEEGKKKKKVK
ncbi:hypothetical protein ONE63_008003 [Megalurothrips usitatus]|uniref:Transmembrane protein n=1 Tax=Megalurothrips usitatus TaxID=439358 RepID=A0AAV7XRZ4_9NEOP|nr:hypothetical protein ONE63_008003 [Megalurothrips usitatus]